jgi:hypothetical protein
MLTAPAAIASMGEASSPSPVGLRQDLLSGATPLIAVFALGFKKYIPEDVNEHNL